MALNFILTFSFNPFNRRFVYLFKTIFELRTLKNEPSQREEGLRVKTSTSQKRTLSRDFTQSSNPLLHKPILAQWSRSVVTNRSRRSFRTCDRLDLNTVTALPNPRLKVTQMMWCHKLPLRARNEVGFAVELDPDMAHSPEVAQSHQLDMVRHQIVIVESKYLSDLMRFSILTCLVSP